MILTRNLLCAILFGCTSAQWRFGNNQIKDPSPPARIYRAMASMSATKMVMDVSFSNSQVFDVYNFRIRWSEPHDWNDNGETSGRKYDLQCWVDTNDGAMHKTLFTHEVNWLYQGYNEKFRFPPGLDLYMNCKVRAQNGKKLIGQWTNANRLRVSDTPVYFPGFEGVNVRGLSQEELINVLAKAAADAYEYDDEDTAVTTRRPTTPRRTRRPATRRTTPRSTTTTIRTTTPTTTTTTTTTTQQPQATTRRQQPWWIQEQQELAAIRREQAERQKESSTQVPWWIQRRQSSTITITSPPPTTSTTPRTTPITRKPTRPSGALPFAGKLPLGPIGGPAPPRPSLTATTTTTKKPDRTYPSDYDPEWPTDEEIYARRGRGDNRNLPFWLWGSRRLRMRA